MNSPRSSSVFTGLSACQVVPYNGIVPEVGPDVFIAPNAFVIGDVKLGSNVSIFFGATLRGDILPIRVGQRSNIQENVVIHTSHGRIATTVGEECTIGHGAILHGCTVGDRVLVGMGATLLDESSIGSDVVIGAGSLVTEHKNIPSRSLVFGSPARVVRELTDEEVAFLRTSAHRYVQVGANYRAMASAT